MNGLAGRLFIAWLICRLIWAAIVYVRGFMYDVQDVRQKKEWQRRPHAQKYRYKPRVSVVIYADNAEAVIGQCIKSIIKGSYRKYEIIVVENASGDNTRQIVTELIASYPKQAIRMIKKRKPIKREAVMASLGKTGYNGEFVLVINADTMLERHTIKNAIHHVAVHQADEVVCNVQFRRQTLDFAGISQYFNSLLASKSRKLTATLTEAVLSQITLVRRSKTTNPVRIYAHDAIITSQPATTYEDVFITAYQAARHNVTKLAFVRHLITAFDVLAFTYLAYAAIALHDTLLFAASWLILVTVLGVAIWNDTSLKTEDKRVFTALLPVAYLFVWIASLVAWAAHLTALSVVVARGLRRQFR